MGVYLPRSRKPAAEDEDEGREMLWQVLRGLKAGLDELGLDGKITREGEMVGPRAYLASAPAGRRRDSSPYWVYPVLSYFCRDYYRSYLEQDRAWRRRFDADWRKWGETLAQTMGEWIRANRGSDRRLAIDLKEGLGRSEPSDQPVFVVRVAMAFHAPDGRPTTNFDAAKRFKPPKHELG